MVKSILFVLLIICVNNGVFAQQSITGNNQPTEKKPVTPTSNSAVGLRKQSSLAKEKPLVLQTPNNTATANHKPAVNKPDAAKAAEIIKTDYTNMPADVKARIGTNKAAGKNLLEGISKVFTVEINSCTTDADQKRILSFLKNRKGFINSEFVAAGRVRIIVEPAFDSVDLKEAMLAEGIRFNFLNRSYLLKK